MLILGIETSCDDTSLALLRGHQILAHEQVAQDDLLEQFGGVVPELAARQHLIKLKVLLKSIFKGAQVHPRELDLIGVTTLPGLLGPLLTGMNTAKSLSLLYETPIVPVNHLLAHLEAIHLTESVPYPYLGLLVSGGHTAFFLMKGPRDFTMLGSTIDDAAGEAFDKGGKLLGLGYPAGRKIDELAREGDPQRYPFPIGLQHSKDARLSFSGIKTALRLKLSQEDFHLPDMAASYQAGIVNNLLFKTRWALKASGPLPIVVGGGVACNSWLRQKLQAQFDQIFFVAPPYCTDNGAMVAHYAGKIAESAVPFPQCLHLDPRSRFIQKDAKGKVELAQP